MSGLDMENENFSSSGHVCTQLQNKSFHVVERTRTAAKCTKMKNARAKRAKVLFFAAKYANCDVLVAVVVVVA